MPSYPTSLGAARASPPDSEHANLASRGSLETWHLDGRTAAVFLKAADLAKRRRFTKDAIVYRQGSHGSSFFFVLDGCVQVSIYQQDGSEFILEVMGRNAICGEGAAVDGGPRIATAVALEDADVLEFDYRDLEPAFSERPELAPALLEVLAIKQRVLGSRIPYMAIPKPEPRIGELLARMAQLYGRRDGEATVLSIELTHEQIAALTGISRVTVTRAFKRLRNEGVIEVHGRQIRILAPAKLIGSYS